MNLKAFFRNEETEGEQGGQSGAETSGQSVDANEFGGSGLARKALLVGGGIALAYLATRPAGSGLSPDEVRERAEDIREEPESAVPARGSDEGEAEETEVETEVEIETGEGVEVEVEAETELERKGENELEVESEVEVTARRTDDDEGDEEDDEEGAEAAEEAGETNVDDEAVAEIADEGSEENEEDEE